jgi:RNA polymerase-interacting CarD/CdnL/TRCF family regulator
MNNDLMELAQGDWIVHSRYGLGQVIGVEEKSMNEGIQPCFNVKTGTFSYWISTSNLSSGRIRRIANTDEFYQAITLIGAEPVLLDENFRNRLQGINNLIAENSILAKARLIRDIHARNFRKDIHANERGMLEELKDQFVDEFMVSCQVSEKTARAQIKEALDKSCANIKPKKPAF